MINIFVILNSSLTTMCIWRKFFYLECSLIWRKTFAIYCLHIVSIQFFKEMGSLLENNVRCFCKSFFHFINLHRYMKFLFVLSINFFVRKKWSLLYKAYIASDEKIRLIFLIFLFFYKIETVKHSFTASY